MAGQTGLCTSTLTEWNERQARNRRQDADTVLVADLLIEAGIPVYREGVGFSLVGLVTGAVKPAEDQYRRIHFLPAVARTLRGEIANGLELHLAGAGKFARYAVVSSGRRCSVFEVRERVRWLSDMIRRWHAEHCKPLGIDVIFRGIELTVDDALTFNVHANVIFVPGKRLRHDRWARFLSDSAAFFGVHWKDNGTLGDVREVVKYVLKGDDLARLVERDKAALVELYHQLYGLHLVQPLGGFRDFRKSLKDRRLKPVTEYRNGKRLIVLTRRPSYNKDREDRPASGWERTNYVVSVDLPKAAFSPVREPVMRVVNYEASSFWQDEDRLRLASQALKDWSRNGGPPPQWMPGKINPPFGGRKDGFFNLDTYTTTVGKTQGVPGGKGARAPPGEARETPC